MGWRDRLFWEEQARDLGPDFCRSVNVNHSRASATRTNCATAQEKAKTMKIPSGCTLKMENKSLGEDNTPTMVLHGSFEIATQADCEQMIEAMQSLAVALAQKKKRKSGPRKKKST